MTNNEFKAWFEGFSEGIDKAPTIKQWAKIKEKVKTINDIPVYHQYITRYVDRYVNPIPYNGWPTVTCQNGIYATATGMLQAAEAANKLGASAMPSAADLIRDIGRKDAAEVV